MIHNVKWGAINSVVIPRQSNYTRAVIINIIGLNRNQTQIDLDNVLPSPNIIQYGDTIRCDLTNVNNPLDPRIIYLNSHLASVNITSNNNPASSNFLSSIYISSNGDGSLPVIQSDNDVAHNFFHFKNTSETASNLISNTTINIMGLHFVGIDKPTNSAIYTTTSVQHNDAFNSANGILVEDFKQVYIDNVVMENIYGTGIKVNNRFHRYQNIVNEVKVNNNIVKNVWALKYKFVNGTYDDRGDGIIFAGIYKGESKYNYIVNDVTVTKQYGRVGLASSCEWDKNITVQYNYLKGYDRNLHLENDHGGHTITNNRLVGTETGIVIDASIDNDMKTPCPDKNPNLIYNNYISNEEIPSAALLPELRKI
jgi:hypothetical protein